jgi:hypothetical protein
MIDNEPDLPNFDILRPVDWRWQLALQLADRESSHCRDSVDEATDRAVRYLLAVRHQNLDDKQSKPPVLEPELVAVQGAHALHTAGGPRAWIVEARLLARQSVNEVGLHVSLPPAVVEMYEALFFAVMDRLEAKVVMAVMAVGASAGAEGCDLRSVLRWLGYNGGPIILDGAIPVLVPSALAWSPTLAPVPEDSVAAIKVRQLAGMMMWPIRSSKELMKLARLHMLLMEATQLEGTNANVSLGDAYEELVSDKVAEMPEDCFLPSRKSNDESPEEVSDEEPAAAADATSWEVA